MGREVRRVAADWEHPQDADGAYEPLFGESYAEAVAEWDEGAAQWANGLTRDFKGGWRANGQYHTYSYREYAGARPDTPEDYMPDWPEAERTHYQMYETTSEGTPISPVMETPEALARWLADTNASAFAGQGASYGAWLRVCLGGYAPSMVVRGGQMLSGVDGIE